MLRWTVHLKGGLKPDDVVVAVEHKVYSFGGCSNMFYKNEMEVYVFNTVSLDWMKLTPVTSGRGKLPPEVPFRCVGHTAVLVEYVIYIWGRKPPYCNRLYAFDVDTHRWLKTKVSGAVPEGRYDHSACVLGKAVYIYGGKSQQPITNDIYKLDTTTMVWSSINARGIPPPTSRCHSANIIGTKMFVFGGWGFNNIGVFDTNTNCWLNTSSAQPHPEEPWRHSAFTYNGELYILGCEYSIQTPNDLWKFNTETFSWKKVEPKGKGPGLSPWPYGIMCCCMVGHRIILFGRYTEHMLVLDLSPSLKTICKLAVIQYGLDQSELPHNVRWELVAMTTDNNNLTT